MTETIIDTVLAVLTMSTVLLFCIQALIHGKADDNRIDIRSLENNLKRLDQHIEVTTKTLNGLFECLDDIEQTINSDVKHIHDRIDNLPSEKAKVIQAKVNELEEMVKELK